MSAALSRLAAALLATAFCIAPCGAARADGALTWVWPTSGAAAPAPQVARRFEPPVQQWSPGHRGADLVAADGSGVHTAGAGVVRFAGLIAGRGVVVVGHPDGTRTTYEPVLAAVSAGAAVSTGQLVGTLSPGGGHCLPRVCLHWGRLRGDVYLDPLALVDRRGPPRLLPVWAAGSVGTDGLFSPATVAGPLAVSGGGTEVDGPGRRSTDRDRPSGGGRRDPGRRSTDRDRRGNHGPHFDGPAPASGSRG